MYRGATDSNIKIVTSGLLEHYDAAQLRSYDGSGTTFTDLSGRNKNGTLVGTSTFSNSYGGQLYFTDGSYITLGDNPVSNGIYSTSAVSFCIWLKLPWPQAYLGQKNICVSSSNGAMWGLNMRYDTSNNLYWDVKRAAGDTAGVSTTFSFDVIYNLVGTYDGSYIRLYVNGSQIGSGVYFPGTINVNAYSPGFTIGGGDNDRGAIRGYVYNSLIYSNALSSTEVLQNYNVIKTRFGL